jgi:hypothetical protein
MQVVNDGTARHCAVQRSAKRKQGIHIQNGITWQNASVPKPQEEAQLADKIAE